MVQWFSPGLLAYTQQFETRFTSGILLDADMGWEVQDFLVLQVCSILSLTWILLCLIAIRRWTSSLKSYDKEFSVLYEVTYQFLRRIQDFVDDRELKRESVDQLTFNPVKTIIDLAKVCQVIGPLSTPLSYYLSPPWGLTCVLTHLNLVCLRKCNMYNPCICQNTQWG